MIRRLADRLEAEPRRACAALLAAAIVVAVGLVLWLGRETTFNVDQIRFFYAAPGYDLGGLLEPQNGNLLLTTTLAYELALGAFGPEMLAFRLLHVAALALAAILLYVLLDRRIGALAALAPTIVLLFFGSDWGHVGTSLGFTVLSSIAAGLGALLLLERHDRGGDLGACALLVVSVASFSIGLAFCAGVAVSVLARPDRLRRAWVFAIPIVVYAAWWLWARGVDAGSQDVELANLLLIPSFAFTSVAAVLASLVGLNYDVAAQSPPEIALGPGPALTIVALALLAYAIARRRLSPAAWAAIAIALAYWALLAVAESDFREPTKTRYMYPGAVMVLLVASAALAGRRPSRKALVALYAVAAVSLATNLLLLRNGTEWFRDQYSTAAKAQFAILDLAGEPTDPNYDPRYFVPDDSVVSTPAREYFPAVAASGSPGFTLAELEAEPESVRAIADRILVSALGLALGPPGAAPADECLRAQADAGGAVELELAAGGAAVGLRSATGGEVALGRFASAPSAELGALTPGVESSLTLPADASSRPWRLRVAPATVIRVCGDATLG